MLADRVTALLGDGPATSLERAGRNDVPVLAVGPADWAASTGGTVKVTA